jgi:hypothetical protein
MQWLALAPISLSTTTNITSTISFLWRRHRKVSELLVLMRHLENEIAEGLNVSDIVEFFEHAGHNLMIFGDIDSRRHARKLANHFGADFEPYVSL